jgi:hypothetical protein
MAYMAANRWDPLNDLMPAANPSDPSARERAHTATPTGEDAAQKRSSQEGQELTETG